MTQSQIAFIQNIKPEESFKFFSQVDDKTIKLLKDDNISTLSISIDDLKFLLDNELINVSDLNVTTAGRIAIVPGKIHSVDVNKLNKFKSDINSDLEEQHKNKLEQLRKQREAEHAKEIHQKAIARKTLLGAFLGIMGDFKRVGQHKEFKSKPIQDNQQPKNMSQQSEYEARLSSQYAQSVNNPNLDSTIM